MTLVDFGRQLYKGWTTGTELAILKYNLTESLYFFSQLVVFILIMKTQISSRLTIIKYCERVREYWKRYLNNITR